MKRIYVLLVMLGGFGLLVAQPPHIEDEFGREMILHGLNTSSGAKHSKGNQPWITEKDVDREYRQFGFNCVRYLIFWGAIEPEQGDRKSEIIFMRSPSDCGTSGGIWDGLYDLD